MRHETIEKATGLLGVLIAITVSIGGIAEIIPLMNSAPVVEPAPGVEPYAPLRLAGRDIYIREGCYNCHSQMVRPLRAETERYGEYSKAGEFVYDHPFQWGSRRIGPDLQRVGGKYPDLWHVRHMDDPRAITPGSIMPAYPTMLTTGLDFDSIPVTMRAHQILGVPYTDDDIVGGIAAAREQAAAISEGVVTQGGPEGLEDKKIIALVAYLQRLGTDITKPAPVAEEEETGEAVAAAETAAGEGAS